MAIYKHGPNGTILYPEKGLSIPPDPANADYQEYLRWDAVPGNTADPADPPPPKYADNIQIGGRIRTTNATPAELYRATLAQLTAYRARLELLAVDNGNGNVRYIEARVVVKRLNNGALMVETPAVIVNRQDAGASTWAITAAVSGNDFVITVTGQVGRNIDWLLNGSVGSYTPGGA